MAYGQTSSGKTFTLMGNDEKPGIIPRFVDDLFSLTEYLSESTFSVQCSFFEIYNESIYDLLNVPIFNHQAEKTNLNLREDPKKGVFVDGLTQEIVSSDIELMSFFMKGASIRTTAETRMNERSSRSHAIFSVIIEHDYIPNVEASNAVPK